MAPQNVILEPLFEDFLALNSSVTYKCRQGFEPKDQFTAVCTNDTTWSPNPIDHVCTGDFLLLLTLAIRARLSNYNIVSVDVDECKLNDTVCPNGSQCINTVGSFTCACEVGYYHIRNENTTLCTGM